MSGFLGMDVGEVDRAGRGVGGCAQSIGDMVSKITGLVRELQENADSRWTGPDAEKFFGQFEELAPLSKDATDRLGERTTELDKRIAAQRAASGME
jgi:hypothetical protein